MNKRLPKVFLFDSGIAYSCDERDNYCSTYL